MLELKYFASLRDQLNVSDESIEWQHMQTVAALKAHLSTRGETWSSLLNDQSIQVAVNQHIAFDHSCINDGDEIAFFPPVTGG